MSTPINAIPTLLNETEAAKILNIKPATLRSWRWLGIGPSFRKIGSNVRYHPDDLVLYIEKSQRINTSQATIVKGK